LNFEAADSVGAKLRAIRNRYVPSLGKQTLLAFTNPALRCVLSESVVRRGLEPLLRGHGIVHLDLGGWGAVEDYLTIHMSPVELHGIPRVRRVAYRQRFSSSDGSCEIERCQLKAPAITLNFDALAGLPIADGTMAGVNMSHFLEHFTLEQGERIVGECRRILRPGGVLRISCPDLARYAAAYVSRDFAFFRAVSGPAFCRYPGLQALGDRFISKAYDADGGHKWFYDVESVTQLLGKAGFRAIEERQLHETTLPHIESIEPAYRARESFYVEAIR
jgi:predicted SAM-dependent methyltransferase